MKIFQKISERLLYIIPFSHLGEMNGRSKQTLKIFDKNFRNFTIKTYNFGIFRQKHKFSIFFR